MNCAQLFFVSCKSSAFLVTICTSIITYKDFACIHIALILFLSVYIHNPLAYLAVSEVTAR